MLENLMADLRRVYCLYRVSTLGQVEKDDIPNAETVLPRVRRAASRLGNRQGIFGKNGDFRV